MSNTAHLWAIGYDDTQRADQVRDEIIELGWGAGQAGRYLILEDIAVAVRQSDGTFTVNRQPMAGVANILGCSGVGFLAGLVVAAPLTGAALGALLGAAGNTAMASAAGITDQFMREVQDLMKPGTSAVFVLDGEGDLDLILHELRGLGGTVLKTNVDLERARLIQSTLSASAETADQTGRE